MLKLYTAVIVTALACATAYAAPLDEITTPRAASDVEGWRLPTTILPVSYNLSVQPYLLESDGEKRFNFSGEVTIEIVANANTNKIIMHSKNLKYQVREYWSGDTPNNKINLPAPDVNTTTDKIAYTLSENLVVNKSYFLHFVYDGTMDDDMHGFYRSYYEDANNNTKWIGSTQFQTNHARRAFPSFDEPKFKATFNLTIKHHRSMSSFANTRIASSTVDGDYVIDEYKTTPKMSTYLLAFIVSEFTVRSNGDQFGVIARPEYYNQSEYSNDVGPKILSELDRYLGIPYYSMGNDKMDLAAIPDFSAGAMENWGLLTYRERALLYDEGSTTLSAKQSIAAVIAHEETHMWFGDLVTCDWWSYTWLNEGFARYFQYFGTAMVEKDWDLEKQFVVDQIQSVMGMDATYSTNPLSDENTNTPSDLSRMFNSISYNKGATVIRMIKHTMSEIYFRDSLQAYLKHYSYQNVVPQNLLDYWKQYWPNDTKSYADAIFKSFTEQVGYPVVHIKVADDGKSFNASQKRFLLKPGDGADSSLQYTVPFTYTTDKQRDFTATTPKYFIEPNKVVTVNVGEELEWVIGNIQETGYYRVNYDTKYWHAIHHALYENNWSGIHELNRAQIVDDLLSLARAGEIDYELALDVLEYLETETNYLPWTSAFNGFNYLAIRLGTDDQDFGKYILQLTEKAYKRLGFEERNTDTTLDIYARSKILTWSCKYGNTECISKAQNYFHNMQSTPVPVNIRAPVYCTAMREGNQADFDALFNKYKTDPVATERTLILNNLGCVKDKSLVEKYFWIIVGDDVRRQDKSSALSSLYTENSENVTPVFELVTENVDKLAESLGSYSSVATVISNIASRFTEESQETKLKEFNANNKSKFGSSAATLEAAEKTVAENLNWAKEKLGVFRTYLQKRNSATSNALTALTLIACALVALLLQ